MDSHQKLQALAAQTDELTLQLQSLKQDLLQLAQTFAPPEPPPVSQEKPLDLPQTEETTQPPITDEEPVALPVDNPPSDSGGWELNLGIKWFSRVGIVVLLVGLILAFNTSFAYFTREMKLLSGWLLAGGFWIVATRIYPRSPILGRVLQGGSMVLGYISLYAMFFIHSVQIWQAPFVGLLCLLVYVGLMMTIAHRLQSQTIALLSVGFGYYTAGFNTASQASTVYHLPVDLLSATLLSFATLGLNRMHPHWHWLRRVAFLGAMLVGLAHPTAHGSDAWSWVKGIYLWGCFALFYLMSLFPSIHRDMPLLHLSVFGFYLTFQCSQLGEALGYGKGQLEVLIALIQAGMLGAYRLRFAALLTPGLRDSLLFLLIFFIGLATFQYFQQAILLPVILAGEALSFALLYRQTGQLVLLKMASYLFWGWAYWCAFPLWYRESNIMEFVTAADVAFIGFLIPWFLTSVRTDGVARFILSMLASFLLWVAITASLENYWFTVSYGLVGFIFILIGLLLPDRFYRRLSLAWFGFAMLRLVFWDMATLETPYKILTLIVLGGALLGASYGYSRLEKRLR